MEECGGTVACVVSCAALCVIGAGAVNAMALAVIGVASGKCGFHTLRAFSPLIPMVCRLFRYSKVYIVP